MLINKKIEAYVSEAKLKSDEVKTTLAIDIKNMIDKETKEFPIETQSKIITVAFEFALKLYHSNDLAEKKAGLILINSLIDLESSNDGGMKVMVMNELSKSNTYTDTSVMELNAIIFSKLAQIGIISSDMFDFEVKKAKTYLLEEQSDRKYNSLLFFRELSKFVPTMFFPYILDIFNRISACVTDPKQNIRDISISVIKNSFTIFVPRENRESSIRRCYETLYKTISYCLKVDNKNATDELIHGSLLALQELARTCSGKIEAIIEDMSTSFTTTVNFKDSSNYIQSYNINKHASTTPNHLQAAKSPDIQAASLLIPIQSSMCACIIETNFVDICDSLIKQCQSKNNVIQQLAITMIPLLCVHNIKIFINDYLPIYMRQIVVILQSNREKSYAFQSSAILCKLLSEDMKPYIKTLLECIASIIPNKDLYLKKKKIVIDPMAIACLSNVIKFSDSEVNEIIGEIFKNALDNSTMTPAIVIAISQNLLFLDNSTNLLKDIINIILFRILKVDVNNLVFTYQNDLDGSIEEDDVSLIVLALRTIRLFELFDLKIREDLYRAAESYLTCSNKDVRMEAAKTCCKLLEFPSLCVNSKETERTVVKSTVSTPSYPLDSSNVSTLSFNFLAKLLAVAITDVDSAIRLCTLNSIGDKHDRELSQQEMLKLLFLGLRDDCLEVREVVVSLLGRLSEINPSVIIPLLDEFLMEILTEIKVNLPLRNCERSARLMSSIISSNPRLALTCMDPILNSILPYINGPNQSNEFTIVVFDSLSDLSFYCGPKLKSYAPHVISAINKVLKEPGSSLKKERSLVSFIQVIQNTGYVVDIDTYFSETYVIFLNLIKNETCKNMRRLLIHALGLIGPRDPYEYKRKMAEEAKPSLEVTPKEEIVHDVDTETLTTNFTTEICEVLMLYDTGGKLEELYSAACINLLLKIACNPSLLMHHQNVIQAIQNICTMLGSKSFQYIPQIFPAYMKSVRICDPDIKIILFEQMSKLIGLAKNHIQPYMNDLFDLIFEVWTDKATVSLQATIIKMVENLTCSLPDAAFKRLSALIPKMAAILVSDRREEYNQIEDNQLTTLLLSSIQRMGAFLKDHLFLLIPAIIKGFDGSNKPIPLQMLAIKTLQSLYASNDLRDFVSPIIQSIIRIINTSPLLIDTAMGLLCTLLEYTDKSIKLFLPTLSYVVMKNKIQYSDFEILVNNLNLESSNKLEQDIYIKKFQNLNIHLELRNEGNDTIDSNTFTSNLKNLSRAWQTTQRVSKEDWIDWWNRLNLEMLKESPSPILRACSTISQSYNLISKELFNLSFLSCWKEFNFRYREDLTKCLSEAMELQDSAEVNMSILNLEEFMEHTEEGALPFKPDLLARCATKASAYVKALRYTEEHFKGNQNINSLEYLISINTLLDNQDAAYGVLLYAIKMNSHDLKMQQCWYEKLHDWDNALIAYNKKLQQDPYDMELHLGKMRCLEALCEWKDLNKLVQANWKESSEQQKSELSKMGAYSSIGLTDWNSLTSYVNYIPRTTFDGSFLRSICYIHAKSFDQARIFLDNARDLLDSELTASLGESYSRGYRSLVTSQFLSELEEIILYFEFPSHQNTIKDTWSKRLSGCQKVVGDWQKILNLRTLVLKPHENLETWLKFSSLCRKVGRISLCKSAFEKLISEEDTEKFFHGQIPNIHPLLIFNFLKYMWTSNQNQTALSLLTEFSTTLLPTLSTQKAELIMSPSVDCKKLLARAYFQLGTWVSCKNNIDSECVSQSLEYFYAATNYDHSWHKGWHAWAIANYDVILNYKHNGVFPTLKTDKKILDPQSNKSIPTSEDVAILYVVPAIRAFFKSLFLSSKNSLQDTLRLLTLWFEYGEYKEVSKTMELEITNIQIDNWMQVVPQLIARVDIPKPRVSKMIQNILIIIGCLHPQALIYPLMVSSKSVNAIRMVSVKQILQSMSERFPCLVEEAILVSTELVRISILWSEIWNDAIEEASRLYFSEKNIEDMIKILDDTHKTLNFPPETIKEVSFSQTYENDLIEAKMWCDSYKNTNEPKELCQAWDLYYQVYRRINKQLNQMNYLELQYVSPKLLECKNISLAVPGTYETHCRTIHIQSISPTFKVIGSKQRPRKFSIRGSDGNNYEFLLKGHEDLRQDERVMQLFGLVNNLLFNNQETFKRQLEIKKYSVTPLSTNSGLIGWVPDCDTLNNLIRYYREKKNIPSNLENRLVAKICPDFDRLDILHKIEVFESVLKSTSDEDLAQVFWKKSINSETWFNKRTNFTRSLSVMSMVGYILGLGDRHPSNIMQERTSGRIIHIDFGDCFEVASNREKYPEKIPFRLTRMLVKCMEVTGIDGTFKITCNRVMEVLRSNKDSLLAVLEAFIYDPLLNWRLLDMTSCNTKASSSLNVFNNENLLLTEEIKSIKHSHNERTNSSNLKPEFLNKRAIDVINRVKDKLNGSDFSSTSATSVDVNTQVELLISQATSIENLCQCFSGWCPYW